MTHRFYCRVYYEDTDMAGIVYYANYLKFIERARTEWVRERGIDQGELKRTEGIVFAVRRVVADYLKPAVFDDELTVETSVSHVSGARMTLKQHIIRNAETVFTAEVTIVPIGADGRPARLPDALRTLIN